MSIEAFTHYASKTAVKITAKVKLSLYSPGEALRVPIG